MFKEKLPHQQVLENGQLGYNTDGSLHSLGGPVLVGYILITFLL